MDIKKAGNMNAVMMTNDEVVESAADGAVTKHKLHAVHHSNFAGLPSL